jgi:site-specific DNA-methyltransferase (adenine-specific)
MVHERKDGKIHEKDEARTPASLFKILDAAYHFDIDAAANETNALCPSFHSDKYIKGWFLPVRDRVISCLGNALSENWYKATYFCNPPYSPGNIESFCKKSYEESLKGAVVVMLLPMDSSTQWFHKYCSKAYKWIIFSPRVKFLHPSGIPFEGSPKFGSFACVFDEAGRRSISSPIIEFVRWKP